jgi:hypothetical protein
VRIFRRACSSQAFCSQPKPIPRRSAAAGSLSWPARCVLVWLSKRKKRIMLAAGWLCWLAPCCCWLAPCWLAALVLRALLATMTKHKKLKQKGTGKKDYAYRSTWDHKLRRARNLARRGGLTKKAMQKKYGRFPRADEWWGAERDENEWRAKWVAAHPAPDGGDGTSVAK